MHAYAKCEISNSSSRTESYSNSLTFSNKKQNKKTVMRKIWVNLYIYEHVAHRLALVAQ